MKIKSILFEMNFKKKVIEKYPNAFVKKIISGKVKGLQDVSYQIYPSINSFYIGYGKTQSSAWEKAYQNFYKKKNWS